MHLGAHAATMPDRAAVIVGEETLSYAELDQRSRRLAVDLRRQGLVRGDTIAIHMRNCCAFFVAAWAAQRSGLYYVPVPTQLRDEELAFILGDSAARAFISDAALGAVAAGALAQLAQPPAVRWMHGAPADGFSPLALVLNEGPDTLDDEVEGSDMLYTSGTTGRPKGVKRPLSYAALGSDARRIMRMRDLFGMSADTVFYTPAPIYHAAPLRFAMTVMRLGGTVVLSEKFDPELALSCLQRHAVTHSQWVPTMFSRLLRLDTATRAHYHFPAHRIAIHSGAPCPVEVKQAMIDWWGPVLHEYYSGTESIGFTHCDSIEWLANRGTVGRPWGCKVHIVGDDEIELPAGQTGAVYFEGQAPLVYHNDAEKTRKAHSTQGWATMGDIGYVNENGYLFLTDRKAFMIVSGGVNIYPREIELVLQSHPLVAEAAVFGVPDPDFGEAVQAVVQLLGPDSASQQTADALFGHVRTRLAGFKRPKRIDFCAELPRLSGGKLDKRALRDDYKARTQRGFAAGADISGIDDKEAIMNITDCLVTLRVKGFVKAVTLAEVTQHSSEAAEAALQGLINDGLAESTKMGVRLTSKGIAAANDQFAREHAGLENAWMHALYERFCVENDTYKKLVTDWQLREVDGARVINDHRDADYDAGLLGDLAALHPRIMQIVQELAARLPRVAGYTSRFERALQRVQNGEIRYMTAPIIDSYHTVWFELHQELINLCGTTRAEEAAQGRAA